MKPFVAAFALFAPFATAHHPGKFGADYLPVTVGPEYVDLKTQILAHSGRKPDFEFHQRMTAEGVRVSEMVDRGEAPGGHSFAVLIVRDAKDKKAARALARAALEDEDWADVGPGLAKKTETVAEHLAAVRKNLDFVDRDASPGYLTVDMVWLKRQLEQDLDGARAALYLARAPRAPKPVPVPKP
jgi:hypothetical protein